MISIFELAVVAVGLAIIWLFGIIKERYIGTENRRRYFAEVYKDFPVYYNTKTSELKKKLFEPLHKLGKNGKDVRILEVGAGPGANFQFYPENTKLTVVDPNPFFRETLEKNMAKYPNVEMVNYLNVGAEDMRDIPDNSVDAVVSTVALCCCDKVKEAYAEIRRVLVPGGTFYYIEHVIDDKPISLLKIFQMFITRTGIVQFFYFGCRRDNDLVPLLKNTGFAKLDIKRFRLDISDGVSIDSPLLCTIIPHIYGTATAP